MEICYKKLDKTLGGLQKGEVTIIAGRPSMCKKTLALNIACNLTNDFNHILVFSTFERKNCVEEKIQKILRTDKDDIDLEIDKNMFINDCPYLTPSYIEKEFVQTSKVVGGVDVVVIEYFNDIVCDEWNDLQKNNYYNPKINRNIVMNNLRKMARDKDIAIILCVNLDREIEERKDHRPTIEDLSRIIDFECCPENVILMFRDYYNSQSDNNKLEVNVVRNRGCNLKKLNFKFIYDEYKLIELDE